MTSFGMEEGSWRRNERQSTYKGVIIKRLIFANFRNCQKDGKVCLYAMLKVNTHPSNLIGASETREAMLIKHLIDTIQAVVRYSSETHFQVRDWKHLF